MKTILQNRVIEYSVKKSYRARHLRIAVNCDAGIVVTTPIFFGERSVEEFLRAKASWVLRALDRFKKIGPTVRIPGGHREYKKYREQARAFVRARIERVNRIYQFSFQRVAIKNHKTRWGSCSRKRNLNFNYKIIFLPERLAEYIVAHELCHLGELNHSRRFWNLLARAIPDCRERARELRRNVF